VVFHLSNNAGQSSSVLNLGTHRKHHPTVKYEKDITIDMVRLDGFFKEIDGQSDLYSLKGIDFLNMDLQGFEGHALKGMGDLIKQFKWIYLECNKEYTYENNMLLHEIEDYLRPFGFQTVEVKWSGRTGWGDCFMIKK